MALVPIERIEKQIHLIRGHKVMLDKDLARLYQVKPIALRQQVKRNSDRFPDDFVFQLTAVEVETLVSQNVIPSRRSLGGYKPYVFTEQGVAMLSSVLKSKRAAQVNIQIMRTFVQLRTMLASNSHFAKKLAALERKYDKRFKVVFDVIKKLVQVEATREADRLSPPPKKPPIGFQSKKR